MNLSTINGWAEDEAIAAFRRCCGSTRWAERMARLRPFDSATALLDAADRTWRDLDRDDWLEAFAAHPRIGDRETLRAKFAATAAWSAREQSGVDAAGEDVLEALADGNRRYYDRFGYIFIVCATGKTAEEMLAILRERLSNDPDREIRIAAAEQARIARIRLEKLAPMSPITTHVLDIARGRPARGIVVTLEIERAPEGWTALAHGTTDDGGRIGQFEPPLAALEPAVYRVRFDTGAYFAAQGVGAFYPEVSVVVQIDDPAQHYHVPLLLSPFGYSTYRGS